jgi:hypothetical protein
MPVHHPSANGNNLLEVLEKILDKGVVIAGDIKISLADVDLLTIKIRLLVASVDKAKETDLIGGKMIRIIRPEPPFSKEKMIRFYLKGWN